MRRIINIASIVMCALMPFGVANAAVSIYAGLGGGADLFSISRDRMIPPFEDPTQPPLNPAPLTQVFSNIDHAGGGVGMAYIGVMYRYKHFGIAGELTGVLDNSTASANITNFLNGPPGLAPVVSVGIRERMENSYFASILPGVFINQNTELFGRIGYAGGKLKVSSTQGSGGNLGLTGTETKNLSGYIFGIGVQTSVTHAVDFRVEYDHAHYNSLTTVTPQSVFFGLGTITSHYNPAGNLVTASIIYHYDFG